MKNDLYPLLFEPIYRNYVWGGKKIESRYNRHIPDGTCAESWEISDRNDGESVVVNGPFSGMAINDLVLRYGANLMGSCYRDEKRFPMLFKIIDAKEPLSVQVHPDEEKAGLLGGEAKAEIWYVIQAEKDARIFAGLKDGTSREDLEKAAGNRDMEDILKPIPVKSGHAVYIPGGLIHAVDRGCLILEVSQNSNTTYRLHDWNRKNAEGANRPLHLKEGLMASDHKSMAIMADDPQDSGKMSLKTPFATFSVMNITSRTSIKMKETSFQILFTVSGDMEIISKNGSTLMKHGTSCLLPASLSEYTAKPLSGASLLAVIEGSDALTS